MTTSHRSETLKNRIRFMACTDSRWTMGQVSTHHRRLIDLLNATKTTPFFAEGVKVRNHSGPQGFGLEVGQAYINPANILFAVPIEEASEGPPPLVGADRYVWIKKKPEPFRFAIGPYEIRGEIHLIEGGETYQSLFGPVGKGYQFVTVTQAEIKRVDESEVVDQQDVIFVNKERIDYFVAYHKTAA